MFVTIVFARRSLVELIVLLSLFGRISTWAAGITFAWNPSPNPAVAGYALYYGLASGDYTLSVDAGANTNVSVSGLTPGLTYYFAVLAYDANDDASPFSSEISYTNSPPLITGEPSSTTAVAGAVASFSVAAVSPTTMSYQWFHGPAAVSGATNAILTLPSVSAANAGSYYVTLQNAAGAATSATAVLTVANVLGRKQYVHSYIGTAVAITPTAGDCLVAFAQVNAIVNLMVSDGVNKWVTQQTAQQTSGEALTVVAATALNVAGTPVTVSFTGSAQDAGITVIEYSGVSGIDASAQATTAPILSVVLNTTQKDAFVCGWGNEESGEDQIYSETFNPGNMAPVLIEHDTEHYEAQWEVLNSNAGFPAGTYTDTYIGSPNGCLVMLALELSVINPPVITNQPVAQSVAAGSSASFSVGASGPAPMTYIWFDSGAAVPGATSAALNLSNVSVAKAGNYSVVISSSAGSVTSSVVPLTVLSPPQHLSASLSPGQGVQLQFTGTPGSPYVLLAATCLAPPINWQPIVTNTADTNGNWTFTDTNALSMPARFYCAVPP
jgi:hypothetical protein